MLLITALDITLIIKNKQTNKKRPVWPKGWMFVYELGGSGFKSSSSHLNFRFRACFKQGVPWHSGNYRVWIQVILLMISNREGRWHYLGVNKLSTLLRGITSKHNGDFYCLNYFYSFGTETNFNHIKEYVKIKTFVTFLSSEHTKILEFNWYHKSDKAPFIIHADLEYLIEKTDECKNNPENLSTTKVRKHIPSGFSMSTMSSFRSIKNKHDEHRGKDCTRKFCENFTKEKR